MIHIIFWLYIFLDILSILVLVDVILSWFMVFWLKWRPQFLWGILDPIYVFVRKHISTYLWPVDFTPIVIIFGIYLFKILIVSFFPEISQMIQLYSGILL